MKSLGLVFPFLFFFALPVMLSAVRTEFQFYGLSIGMPRESVEALVASNSSLKIDDSRYFGKINDALPFTLKLSELPYIPDILLQFYSNRVWAITVQFAPGTFDFLTLSERLEDRYGTARRKTSQIVSWEGIGIGNTNSTPPDIRMQLEYPSTLKVYDAAVMRMLHEELSNIDVMMSNTSLVESNRQRILGEL
jgi:hypothetical protein